MIIPMLMLIGASVTFVICLLIAPKTRKRAPEHVRNPNRGPVWRVVNINRDYNALLTECSIGLFNCICFILRPGVELMTDDIDIIWDSAYISVGFTGISTFLYNF